MAKIDLWELFVELRSRWSEPMHAHKCVPCNLYFQNLAELFKHFNNSHQPEFLQFKRELAEALNLDWKQNIQNLTSLLSGSTTPDTAGEKSNPEGGK